MTPGTRPCFVCGRTLDTEESSDRPGPEEIDVIGVVYHALIFRATGNYGSTIFDPPHHEVIEIAICDACVAARADRAVHLVADGPDSPTCSRRTYRAPTLRDDVKERLGIMDWK